MRRTYDTPGALTSALSARAKPLARQQGIAVGEVLRRFYFQRLLARVFTHDPSGWLLKGGQALLVRYPDYARNSRDVDLFRPDAQGVDEAVAALRAAIALDLGDHFTFSMVAQSSHGDDNSGVKVTVAVSVGSTNDNFVIDLVTGRIITAEPAVAKLQPAVPVEWPDDWPDVVLYPLPDHIADKICAMYEWHNGKASTRFRDLVDLILISQREVVHGRAVQNALLSEKRRRLAKGVDLQLPSSFEIPDVTLWAVGYPREAALSGLEGRQTLAQAELVGRAFVSPLLDAKDPGWWNPRDLAWKPDPS